MGDRPALEKRSVRCFFWHDRNRRRDGVAMTRLQTAQALREIAHAASRADAPAPWDALDADEQAAYLAMADCVGERVLNGARAALSPPASPEGSVMADDRSKYRRPADAPFCLAHVAEECGEVVAAIGKTLRWGLDSVNPDLPSALQETNQAWVLREIADLERSISILRSCITATIRPPDIEEIAADVEGVG